MGMALEGERLVTFRLARLDIGRIYEWRSERGFHVRVRRDSQEIYIVRVQGRIIERVRGNPRHATDMAKWIMERIWRPLWTIFLPRPPLTEGQPEQLLLPGFGYEGAA